MLYYTVAIIQDSITNNYVMVDLFMFWLHNKFKIG